MKKLIPHRKITDLLIDINVDEKGIAEIEYDPEAFLEKATEYLEHIEGFFYSLRGCLDSFFWELNLVYELGLDIIYRDRIIREMEKKRNSKEITKLLQKLGNQQWFKYLSNVRNELTHHILSELVTYTEDKRIYLPSDPKKNDYTKNEEFEVLTCLTYLRNNVIQFLEKGYKALLRDLNL